MNVLKSGAFVGHFKLTGRLGEGSSGEVFTAVDTTMQPPYEVFVLKMIILKNTWRQKEFEREVQSLLKCSSCPLIVNMKQYFKYQQFGVIVLEKLETDLLDYIQAHQPLHISFVKKIFFQVCCAVLFLHKKSIAHLDIKPENIFFIPKTETVKLGDFGSSYQWKKDFGFKLGAVGTSFYCAPEVAPNHPYDPSKADIWSLGILLHVLLTGFWPFQGKTEAVLNENVKAGNVSFFTKSLPQDSELFVLLRGMLDINPETRFSIKEVTSSTWLCNIDEPVSLTATLSSTPSFSLTTLNNSLKPNPRNDIIDDHKEEPEEGLSDSDGGDVFNFSDDEDSHELIRGDNLSKTQDFEFESYSRRYESPPIIEGGFTHPNSLPGMLTPEHIKEPRYMKNKKTEGVSPVMVSARDSPKAEKLPKNKSRRASILSFFNHKRKTGFSPDVKKFQL